MKLRFILLFLSFIALQVTAAVDPPSIRCVEVEDNGDVVITWQPPPNNFGQFREYEIYGSNSPTGPYTLLGTVNVWGTNFFIDAGANVPAGGQRYYYIITRFEDNGLQSSNPSDTVSPMLLNMTKHRADLAAALNWNPIHDPKFPTNNQNFEVFRRLRLYGGNWGAWNRIALVDFQTRFYNDSVSICDGAVGYKIEVSDQLGCRSRSNMEMDTLFDLNPPNAPVIDSVSVDNQNGRIKIAWKPSSSGDVTGYIITRGQFPNTVIIDTVIGRTKNTYIDDDNALDFFSAPVYYQVTAIDSCGNTRPAPKEHSTINLKSENDLCAREINLSWNNYDGWPSVQRYTVYVREDAGPYRLLADLDGNTRNYTHRNIDATKVYCYLVVGASNGTQEIYYSTSNLLCVSFPALEAPLFEYIRSVSVLSDDSIRILAYLDTSVSEDAVRYYLLRRAFDREGPFITIDTLRLDSSVYELDYIDANVRADQYQYAYVMDAMDDCDQVIKRSNVGRSIHLNIRGGKYDYLNELNWTQYIDWQDYGFGVGNYEVYLGLNGEFDPNPIGRTNAKTFNFYDPLDLDVQFASSFCYYVEAIEADSNVFGFLDAARSNVVCVTHDPDVYIPDVFTPNKDGLNEFWKPIMPYIDPADYTCDVYDRWGTKIFSINEQSYEGFPGENADGEQYPSGVYIYHLQAFTEGGSLIERKGRFILIR